MYCLLLHRKSTDNSVSETLQVQQQQQQQQQQQAQRRPLTGTVKRLTAPAINSIVRFSATLRPGREKHSVRSASSPAISSKSVTRV